MSKITRQISCLFKIQISEFVYKISNLEAIYFPTLAVAEWICEYKKRISRNYYREFEILIRALDSIISTNAKHL